MQQVPSKLSQRLPGFSSATGCMRGALRDHRSTTHASLRTRRLQDRSQVGAVLSGPPVLLCDLGRANSSLGLAPALPPLHPVHTQVLPSVHKMLRILGWNIACPGASDCYFTTSDILPFSF